MRENCQGLDPEARIRNKAVLVTSNVTAVFMSFSLFASDFRGFSPRPGPVLPVSGHRGSALPAAAALALPGSPGAGPPSRPPVRPRARLPSFPGVRSGRLFQPLSRSNRPFETFRGRKTALRGSRGRPGASGAEALPLPQAGSASGSSAAGGLPAGRPPFGSQRHAGPFSAPGRCGSGPPCGLKARTGASGAVQGRLRAVLPLRPGLLPGPWPIFGSQKPAGPFSAPGRCWKRWKRSCGLKARTGASWGRPGPSLGRSLLPRRLCLSPVPLPPLFFLTPCM